MNSTKLLELLQTNARMSVEDLAVVLKESDQTIRATIEQLEKDNIISGYHTVINWDKTNHDTVSAIIEVSARPERDAGYDKVAKQIYLYPEVSSMYLMSGSAEFMVIIEGKTMQEVAKFVAQKLATIDGVTATKTHFILKRYKIDGVVLEKEEKTQERMIFTP